MSIQNHSDPIWLPSASLATRRIPVVGKQHFTGEVIADGDRPRIIRFESHLEMQVIEVLRARLDVVSIVEQPEKVTWRDASDKIRHHTFDLLVTLTSRERVAVAVKPAAKVRSSGIRIILAEISVGLDPAFADRVVLITDRDLDPVEIRNATLLNRLARVDAGAMTEARRVVSCLGGGARIGDISKAIGRGPSGARAVLSLIRVGELKLVRREVITPDSVVLPARCAA